MNTLLAAVTSDTSPRKHQKNRSSGNFSTNGAPGDTQSLVWNISTQGLPQGTDLKAIVFDVKHDESAGSDKVIFTDLTDGSITTYKGSRQFYIANPSGAPSSVSTFVVEVSASPDEPPKSDSAKVEGGET